MATVAFFSFLAFFIFFADPAPEVQEIKVEQVGGKAPYYEGHDDEIAPNPNH